MKSRVIMSAVVALALAALPAATMAADVTVGADVNSAYVWRSLTFNDGLVVQPSVDVTHPAGVRFNVWGNFDLDSYDGAVERREFSEVDLTIAYALPLEGPFSVEVGVVEYLFPKEGNYVAEVPEGHPEVEAVRDTDTREVFVSLGFEIVDGLGLSANVYYDVDEVEGLYGDLGIAYGYDVTEALSLEAGAKIGAADKKFAEYYAGGTEGGLFDWNASLSATYAVTEAVELGAFITYADNVNTDAFPDDSKDKDVFGGVSVYYTF